MRIRHALILGLGLIAALAVKTQLAQESAPKGETVLRVVTHLIEVNVVAQDSKGRAAKGLTRDDFRLFDNGKEVPVDVFSSTVTETRPEITALPPHTYSNRIQGAPPSVSVILLDGLNTALEDQTWARAEVIRFLEVLKPQDRVAIFLLGDHLFILQNFTSDHNALLAVLKNNKGRVPAELQASMPPTPSPGSAQQLDLGSAIQGLGSGLSSGSSGGSGGGPSGGSGPATGSVQGAAAQNAQAQEEAVMEQFEQHMASRAVIERVYRTTAALMAIANYLKQFPGRKNLIWVSGGFPVSIGFDQPRAPGDTRDQMHFTPELERAFKALNNADLAVYPVDARGLMATTGQAIDSHRGGMDMNSFYSTQGVMTELADHTGGKAFLNTNDLAGVIRTAVDDSQADYTLGFYPHNIKWDGEYHELTVKVTRRGVHVRHRKGYNAALDEPGNEEETTSLFNRALYSPLDSTGLGLTVALEKISPDPRRAVLRITLDAHNITFQDKNGDKVVQLEMVFAQSGADGKILKSFRQTADMRLAGKGMDVVMNRGLSMGKWVGLEDGATMLELVVRDPASGNVGSVRVPLGTT